VEPPTPGLHALHATGPAWWDLWIDEIRHVCTSARSVNGRGISEDAGRAQNARYRYTDGTDADPSPTAAATRSVSPLAELFFRHMAPDRAGRQSAGPPAPNSTRPKSRAPLNRARSHLRKADPVLARLIDTRPTLIVALGRQDVVLPGDLALRKAIRGAYELDHLPSQAEVLAIAEKWRPYRSVATSYLFSA